MAAGASGAAALLAACGGDDSSSSSESGGSGAGAATAARQATPTGEAPKYGGQLTVGISAEPRGGFDAHTGFGGEEHQFLYMVTDQLIGYDKTGQLDPALSLAERWELAEPTRIVLKLRSGVTFHDGAPFSAEDVKWNLERIINPATAATPRSDIGAIESVQVVNPTEAVLRLKEPSAPLLTNFGDRGGMIVPRAAFERMGKDAFIRKPVGTGPFILKEWISDAHMVLEQNPNYWRKDAGGGKLPYLQTIRFEFIPEAAVRSAALESGQIDLLAGTPATDVQRLDGDRRLQSTKFVGSGTGMIYINHAFPPLDNVNFRRAFASALDRENYIKNFLTGEEPVATGLLTPASWAHDPSIPGYGYDLNKAKDYLQRSGLPPSAWRIKAQPQGESIVESEQFWEASIKAAGIAFDWNQPERGGSRTRLYKGQGADGTAALVISSWSLRVDPDGNISQFYTEKGAYNSGQAPVPEVEPLVARARQAYDQQERKKLYGEIQRIAAEQLYSNVPLFYSVARSHASKKVGNLDALYGGEGKPRYANMWISG
jgi:peptide/nickel transport system substrate-binding protein